MQIAFSYLLNTSLIWKVYKQKKSPLKLMNELFSKTAAIYSPTFTQYHRRGWA